ncbi:sigma-70 family RNA polymerase sigma factor [Fredinandcohnia sp. QZ13]|uniref:sigma-70 family RNA polymerase sigma factor n=1 Tax=Fredinandcohnia sp. QZ13 TaxID=3073144 RepID=UPI0028534C6A|nr:sigma-70 family RNA polymerase sigma factor [Fredinandcohnia sp. QZ13]MDR4890108.1 sigma-70 family RNA polymerase sigma factor [Fredinandcohnia sp. QZ13]
MAFEELAEQYKPLIFQVIKSLRLYGDKETFYQIGLIGLWEASTRFAPEKGVEFSTFAYSTIRGKLLDHLKKEALHRERCQPTGELLILSPTEGSNGYSPDLIEEYSEGLTDNQVKWVQGRIIEDKSYKEIADEHGVTVESVKSWGRQAVKKLRKIIMLER